MSLPLPPSPNSRRFSSAPQGSNKQLEKRILALFQEASASNGDLQDAIRSLGDMAVDHTGHRFQPATAAEKPSLTHFPPTNNEEVAKKFLDCTPPELPTTSVEAYCEKVLKQKVTSNSAHLSCPRYIGHMTSSLPSYMGELAKLVVSMNQNIVKIETAPTVTFLERELMAQLHRLFYYTQIESNSSTPSLSGNSSHRALELPAMPSSVEEKTELENFYQEHVQNPESVFGLMCSGGTLANVCALWVARNRALGASDNFAGVEKAGLAAALKHYGYSDVCILGSTLMHYSMDKAADILGLGTANVLKVKTDDYYRVDVAALREKILECREQKKLILAIVGICGGTETGAIDSLGDLGEIAHEEGIYFHVDAAWGGALMFSETHRWKVGQGMRLADSVTIDGHKQLWVPMGCGMVLFRHPAAEANYAHAISKTANYIIRKGTFDLGRFTPEGSRPANCLYLHMNLHVLGVKGLGLMYDRTVTVARYMARRLIMSQNFELLVQPMSNILLYRWLPFSLREKLGRNELTSEDQTVMNEITVKIQEKQRMKGVSFVSRTTFACPKYDYAKVVGFRVVIGNPCITERDIDQVLMDQHEIITSGEITDDFLAVKEALVARGPERSTDFMSPVDSDGASRDSELTYWQQVWETVSERDKKNLWGDDVKKMCDFLITPAPLYEDGLHGLDGGEEVQRLARCVSDAQQRVREDIVSGGSDPA